MTLLARPKPGPPPTLAAAFCRPNRLARLRPRTDEPPMRNRSRRVMPSQVSCPERPGITSMAGTSLGRRADEGRDRAVAACQAGKPDLRQWCYWSLIYGRRRGIARIKWANEKFSAAGGNSLK